MPPGAPVTAAPRRRLRPRLLPGREPAPLPRGRRPARLRPPLPGRKPRRPRPRQRRRGHRRRARRAALQGPRSRRRGRPGRGRVHLRQVPARQARPDPDPGQRARRADPRRPARLAAADPGRQPEADDQRQVQAAGEAALAAKGLPGAFVTMNVHNGEILGMGSFPTYDPSVFTEADDPEPGQRPLPRPDIRAADEPRDRRPLSDAARPSRSSPRWRRSKTAQ